MRSLKTMLVLLFVSSFSLHCSAQDAVVPKTIKPAETEARPICVTDKWAVWEISKLVESTKLLRVPSYDYAFYRQRVTDKEATLIHTMRDRPGGISGTVTDDGTFMMNNTGYISWHTPGKPAVKEPELRPTTYILASYPDGVLTYRYEALKKPMPVAFIPFKDHRLDLEASVPIITTEDAEWRSSLGHFDPHHFVRHENSLALLLYHKKGLKQMPDGGWKASLFVFDLKAKKHRTVPLAVGLEHGYHATGFDGDVFVLYRLVFDAKTGEVVGPRDDRRSGTMYAVRNRFGYYFSSKELYAVNLTSKDRPAVMLSAAPYEGGYAGALVAQSENGIIVWNGKTWATIPWIKEWPEKK